MPANHFRRRTPVEPGPRKGRMLLTSTVLAIGFAVLMIRAWDLQVRKNAHYVARSEGQYRTTIELRASRGAIYDRNGRELALSAMVPSVFAIPRTIPDAAALAPKLAAILEMDEATVRRRLSGQGAFRWLKRHVAPEVAAAIEGLAHPGIQLRDEPRRFYPNRALAGGLIGFAGIDGEGLEGIERDFDRYLQGRVYTLDGLRDAAGRSVMPEGALPVDQLSGYALTLTIDARIQQIAEAALIEQVELMKAKGGVVVVLDPKTGDLIAMAQTPAFDPNLFKQAQPGDWRLRAITDVLEPGSTIKPLLVAAALDAGKTTPDAVWNGYYGRMKVGRKTVTDVHGEKQLTTLEVIQKSSNVGAVQIGQRLGKEAWHSYLRAYGFGQRTGIGLRGEREGSLAPATRWGIIHLATMSYGYGLDATPLQLARAMSVLANGGVLMRPRLVREVTGAHGKVIESFPPRPLRRVISEAAAAATMRGLVMVTENGGTGKRARVPGYTVGGKTGTAHKIDPVLGGYSKTKVWSSFSGFVPAEDPRLVIYVAVDEPTEAEYGGVVAAPVFARVAREALPYLGVEATAEFTATVDDESDYEEVAEGIDPQARPWWFEESVLTGAPGHLVVPDLKGQPLAAVIERASALRLKLRIEGAGLVVSQIPQPGSLLPPDALLTVALALPGTPRAAAGEERAR